MKAVVLLSGGLDSATVLAIAQSENRDCIALSFAYGQRHEIELAAARRIAQSTKVREHVVYPLDLRVFGGSALTADIAVPKDSAGAPGIPAAVASFQIVTVVCVSQLPIHVGLFNSCSCRVVYEQCCPN